MHLSSKLHSHLLTGNAQQQQINKYANKKLYVMGECELLQMSHM